MSSALGKPCIVLAQSDDGTCKGSGRGVQGLDLVDALSRCQEFLTHWGGHRVAVGLTLEKENLEPFTEAFVATVDNLTGGKIAQSQSEHCFDHRTKRSRPELLHELVKMAPFGQRKSGTRSCLEKHQVSSKTTNGWGWIAFSIFSAQRINHRLRHCVENGRSMPPSDQNIDLAFRLKWNNWNGRRNLQMELQDWKLSVSG